MPRVVPDQRSKFENEEFFRKLSRECEIKYTGFRDRPHEERQARFQNACRDGRSEIAFVATGTNLSLQFFPASWQGEQRQTPTREYVDFEREAGKVYLKAPMILNGVCVIWKGWIDLQRLDGMGCLEFDEERAQLSYVGCHDDFNGLSLLCFKRKRIQRYTMINNTNKDHLDHPLLTCILQNYSAFIFIVPELW
ncbi:core-binding factor subunit beta isoform 1-T1 [Pangshura tecta]